MKMVRTILWDGVETLLVRFICIERFGIDGAHAATLRAAAQDVRAAGDVAAKPTRSATQRALDLQDGRVLLLIEVIVRAFREAHRENTAIALPDLNRLRGSSRVARESVRKRLLRPHRRPRPRRILSRPHRPS